MGLTRPRASQIYDIDYKQAVRVVAITNITLSGGAPNTVDGITISANDRILVTGQGTTSENGFYFVETLGTGSNGTWVRTLDTDTTGELLSGTIVMVTEGNVYRDTQWVLTTENPIVIGTTGLNFKLNAQLAFGNVVAGSTTISATRPQDTVTFSAGNNISITGNSSSKTATVELNSNISVSGNSTASYFIGDGSLLANINIGNVGGSYANSNVAAYLPTYTGNLAGGNANIGGNTTVSNLTVSDQLYVDGTTIHSSNVIPSINNVYTLGNSTNRWANVWLGPGTIYITDTANTANTAELTVSNGILQVNGATGLQANLISGNTTLTLANSGNISLNVAGTANAALFTSDGISTVGNVYAVGNVTGTYIKGDGSYLTGLGGSFAQYVMANVASATVPADYQLQSLTTFVPGTTKLVSQTVTTTPTLLASFLTNAGYPGTTAIPPGYFQAYYETTKNSGNQSYRTYFTVSKRTAAGVTTLLLTSDYTTSTQENILIQQSTVAQNTSSILLATTDQILIEIYAVMLSNSATIALGFDDNTDSRVIFPVATPDSTVYVPYNNAIKDLNLDGHNFTTNANITTGNITSNNVVNSVTISASGNVTAGSLTVNNDTVITGNLTVNGTTTTINSNTITTNDLAITLGNNQTTGTALNGAGISVGSNDLVTWKFNNATTSWQSNVNILPTTNATLNLGGASNYWDSAFIANASISGNVIGGNLLTSGLISATGAITGASLTVSNGTITVGNIVNNNSNGVGNIGSSSTYFNTVFAKATSAQYADLAEMYVSDTDYKCGTVVEFGGEFEVTLSVETHSTKVAGIISTNPSYLMNSTQEGEHVLPVALTGRVPCSVVGKIEKGDRLVSSDIPGVATALDNSKYQPGCIIGKSLEAWDSDNVGVIEVAVGRT